MNEPDRHDAAATPNAGPQREPDIENNIPPPKGLTRDSIHQQDGPPKVLEPFRTDPVKAMQTRHRRLERLSAVSMPEIHFVGQIVGGERLISDGTEGACCRWKIDHGKAWQHLGGDLVGQTQFAYCRMNDSDILSFNHPIDAHFAAAGLQGWGSPRLSVQCYRLDWHGRRLLCGYGFAHLPIQPGAHRIEISVWRPVGSPDQELDAYLLGRTPSLVSHEPIYESAWKERSRMVTVSGGKVIIDLIVVTRYLDRQGVDEARIS